MIYQEIYEADVRKLKARSADVSTGGGARDFRFPAAEFGHMFRTFFPSTTTVKRRRDGERVDLEINVGEIHWTATNTDGQKKLRRTEVKYEPPTTARPSEDRLSKVHEVPPLDPRHLPPPGEGVVFVLFVQDEHDRVWAYYTSEDRLRQPGWEPAVAEPILRCLDAPARQKMKRPPRVQGYIDLTTNRRYCHGI